MEGSYVATDGIHTTIYSILGVKGFRSSWGNFDPAATNELIEAYNRINSKSCESLNEYSDNTNTRNFIANETDLSECGYKLIYSSVYKVYKRD